MNNCAGAQVVFQSASTTFTQTLNLPVTTSLGAYLRLEYNTAQGTVTARYRQTISASWLSFPAFTIGNVYGGTIPAANLRFGIMDKNWSGKRGFHYFTYLAAGNLACNNAGCARLVSAPTTTAIVSGLSPSTQYTFSVSGVSQFGPGSLSAPSGSARTLAVPTPTPVPVVNVALGKPSSAIATWCQSTGVCGVASYGERCVIALSYRLFPASRSSFLGNDGILVTNQNIGLPGALICMDTGQYNGNPVSILGMPRGLPSVYSIC